jgi:hypothetical protein
MQEQKNNHFGAGFVLGLLFGVCLTLLLVTKKGRKLLRTLSEEGVENMKDLKSKLRQADIAIDEDLYLDDLEEQAPATLKEAVVKAVVEEEKKPEVTLKKPAKKLFRGIPKKS